MGRFAMPICVLAVILSRLGVFFSFLMFAVVVVMRCLTVMMRGRVMGRGGVVVMLARWVLLLA